MKADWSSATGGRAAAPGTDRDLSASRWVRACLWLLLAVGIVARLSPLFDVDRRLYWLFLSEDGYLMQTIARNMAIGLGMSTANGTMPTNGVQPLATFVYAGLHMLAGGSKLLAIAYVTLLATAVSALAAWFLWRLVGSVLRERPFARDVALLASALWFASPFIIRHSMNGLETGMYYLAIAATLVYYFSLDLSGPAPMRGRQRLAFGLLLGLAFLTRNDAVFFIGAVLAAHGFLGGPAGGGFGRRAVDAVVAGSLSLAVASPWLVYNKLNFGSVVPISGSAQSHSAGFGANLAMIPANLIEASLLYVRIPASLEASWPVVVVSIVVLASLAWAAWSLIGRSGLRGSRFCVIALLFSAGIAGYYGLFFGAAWFVSRYLSALSILLWPLCAAVLWLLLAGMLRERRSFVAAGAALASLMLLVAAGFAVAGFRSGVSNGHRQVVEWVGRNVDDKQWVGGIQTGTLGYFHDRTINLDGKVNPKALQARIARGQVMTYVLDETPINYLADWVGVAGWTSLPSEPRAAQAFEVVVNDKAANLGVLRRRVPVAAAP